MATWQLLALTEGKSCTFTLFQVKEEEQCEPGELCWDEIPSAQLQREPQPGGKWWRRRLPASSVPQCSSGQGRAAQSAQEQLRSRARLQGQVWTLLWVFMHPVTSRNNEDSKCHTETVALQVLFQEWLAGSSGRLGTDHHPPPSPLPSPLWRQLRPHLHGLEQLRHILGIWTLLQGRE